MQSIIIFFSTGKFLVYIHQYINILHSSYYIIRPGDPAGFDLKTSSQHLEKGTVLPIALSHGTQSIILDAETCGTSM
jgi:hypothetical protein